MKQKFAKILLEHDRGIIHLTFLNDAVDRIMTHGINNHDYKILNNSIDFLRKDLHEHCKNEEEEIYPDLSGHITEEIILEMKSEHQLISSLIDELKIFLYEIERKQNGKALMTILKAKSKLLIEVLSNHIKKENILLHRIARQTFTERDFHYLYKTRKESL